MSDIALFHSTQSKLPARKIHGELLSTGHIRVDWSELPKHANTRRYVMHWKSLNSNRVGELLTHLLREMWKFDLE